MISVDDHHSVISGYGYFGATRIGTDTRFRVWSPNAKKVFLTGDFCEWRDGVEMSRYDGDVWQCVAPSVLFPEGCRYKYRILTESGEELLKADPYATRSEESGGRASVICDIDAYSWHDGGWLSYRKKYKKDFYASPMNIYQLSAQSWRTSGTGGVMSYRELATELAPYVKQLGYTHVQLLPCLAWAEMGVWSHRVASYFAPHVPSAHPCDLMSFVDSMHEAGIGVIFELPLADVSSEEEGLLRFDGQAVYERGDGQHPECFNTDSREVCAFLDDICTFWIDKYHVDGLCLGGVVKMLEDEHHRVSAERFFAALCDGIRERYEDVLLCCDGNSYGMEGLRFDMVCSAPFARDLNEYVETDPFFRKHGHERITLWAANFASQRCILPLRADDGRYIAEPLMSRIYGDYWQKFAGTRALLGYQMAVPGKKLIFMGNEIGQFDPWDHRGELQWFLLDYDSHAKLQRYVAELGQLYLSTPELWQGDGETDGFEWIDVNNREQSIVSFCRRDADGNELVAVVNFTPVAYENYRLGVKSRGDYREIFNSDDERFGGSGVINTELARSEAKPWNWLENSIVIRIPPMAITVFKCVRRTPTKQNTPASTYSKRKIIKF